MKAEKVQKSQIVPREKFLQNIEEHHETKVIIFEAGAGLGKTVTARFIAEHFEGRTFWMSCVPEDNELQTFWGHFIHNAELSMPEVNKAIKENGYVKREEWKDVVQLMETLQMVGKVIMIFDNLQVIHNRKILQFFRKLTMVNSGKVIIVLLTRTGGPIHYILQSGNLSYVMNTDEELKFSYKETERYFALRECEVDHSNLKEIYEWTEGIPGFVSLFYLRMKECGRNLLAAPGIEMDLFFQLLEKYVWNYLDAEKQEGLIELSYIEYFPLKMIEEQGLGELLIQEKLNGLIYYDRCVDGYRFYQSICQFIRKAGHNITGRRIQAIYKRVASWFEINNRKADAVLYYRKLEQHDKVWELLWDKKPNRYHVNYSRMLMEAIEQFPEEFKARKPEIKIIYGRIFMDTGSFEQAKEYFVETIEAFKHTSGFEQHEYLIGEAYIYLGYIDMMGGNVHFLDNFQKAYEYLPDGTRIYDQQYCLLQNGDAITLQHGKTGEMERWVKALEKAEFFFEHLLKGIGCGFGLIARAEAYYYTGNMEAAEQYAFRAIGRGREKHQADIVCNTYFLLCKIALANGKYSEVISYMEELNKYYEKYNRDINYTKPDMIKSWFYMKMGDYNKVEKWILEDETYYSNRTLYSNFGNERIIKMNCMLQQQKYYELLPFVEETEELYKKRNQFIQLIYVHIYKAVIHYELNNGKASAAALERAYQLSDKNNIIMPYVECAVYLRKIFDYMRQIPEYHKHQKWVTYLYPKICLHRKREHIIRQKYREKNNLTESSNLLGFREREILEYISHGMTRSEIAEQMGIASGTVKSTLNTIYDKLGAINAPHAVRIAIINNII